MRQLDRRSLLWAGAVALGGALLPPSRATRAAAASRERVWSIGDSQRGQPLVVHRLGRGPRRIFILGGQHGAPEANTVDLARELLDFFVQRPAEIPPGTGLEFMPLGNPDGLVAGTRGYASGVDPNRNWGGPDWRSDASDSVGRYRPGLGGAAPFSEPETRALATWLTWQRPTLVVNYHSSGGFFQAERDGLCGELAAIYAAQTDYWWPPDWVDPFGYPVTGSLDAWLTWIGSPNIFVELLTDVETELEPHLQGLRAILARLARRQNKAPARAGRG